MLVSDSIVGLDEESVTSEYAPQLESGFGFSIIWYHVAGFRAKYLAKQTWLEASWVTSVSNCGIENVQFPMIRQIIPNREAWRIEEKVSNQLDRLYLKFLTQNPGYDGKAYAHLTIALFLHQSMLLISTVLSYDILCHQENLSSPFPVDWMCKEYPRSEESSLDMSQLIDQPGGNNSNVVNEAEGIVLDPVDEEMMSARSALVHDDGLADDFCTISSPLASNLDETISDSNFMQMGGTQGNGKAIENKPKQPVSNMLAVGQDEAPKSYTPYIKYTKLEFKVDTFFGIGSPLGVLHYLRNIRIGIGKGQKYWAEENISEEMPASMSSNVQHFSPLDQFKHLVLLTWTYAMMPLRLHVGIP
ncbi:unnamed protein product [Dovyalis caffra]|uniref:Uncharacterized protein n=1 Tax=Dovyalis caffra TaxID=77055 RepID=A0AAV1S553_9ROSI|nr:unnamed protein product [Dovyalis caffra]